MGHISGGLVSRLVQYKWEWGGGEGGRLQYFKKRAQGGHLFEWGRLFKEIRYFKNTVFCDLSCLFGHWEIIIVFLSFIGLLSYSMPPGNVFGGKYNFSDYSYSGTSGRSVLTGGQGVLTDHVLASDNYADDDGKGWIGWQRGKTSSPYITFTFVQPRVFQSVTFHCNIRTREEVKLFSAVHAKFRLMDSGKDMVVDYVSPDIDSAYGWLSYNVTVNLCGYQAQVLRFDFEYGGEWILLSEVSFITGGLKCYVHVCWLRLFIKGVLDRFWWFSTTSLKSQHFEKNLGGSVGCVYTHTVATDLVTECRRIFLADPVTPDSRPHCLPPTTPPLLETSAFNGTVALVPHCKLQCWFYPTTHAHEAINGLWCLGGISLTFLITWSDCWKVILLVNSLIS